MQKERLIVWDPNWSTLLLILNLVRLVLENRVLYIQKFILIFLLIR